MTPQRPIGPRRRLFQPAACLTALLLPFGSVHGESLLRIDLSRRALVVLGQALYVEELFLLLLAALMLLLLFLLLTLFLGRVWCGWACPQTILSELVERFGTRPGGRHAASLVLSVLLGANALWYFLPPWEFFPRLAVGTLPAPALFAWVLLGAVGYLDLAFVRRSFCRSLCPYARIQAVLTEPGSLSVGLLPSEAARCVECGGCGRACPLGIDPRCGDDAACIQCGVCVDTCRKVLSARGQRAVLGYSFGAGGFRNLLDARTALLALATLAAGAALTVAAATRAPVKLTVRRASAAVRTLADGRAALSFTGLAGNRGGTRALLKLAARTPQGRLLDVRGSTGAFELGPGEHHALDFTIVVPAEPGVRSAVIVLTGPAGETAAETRVELPVANRSR